ncbi:retrovirus-related Pol polyprotein from transposon TNT 1-94 [Trichonephila clavipes]|nr:retrovirus-related Pol polyprotein from transposon TNT 1-94 [Trichonephila clavipes]
MNSVASTLNRVTDMEFNNQISVLTPNNWNTWKHDMQRIQSTVQQIYRWKEEDFRVVKIEAELILEANRLQLMKQDLEKAENAYLSSFTSNKSKTLPGATAAAHGDPNGKNDYQKKSGKVFNCKTIKNVKQSIKTIGPCYVCNKYGHLKVNCKEKKSLQKSPSTVNETFNTEFDKGVWVIDTAATSHFCNDKSLFLDLKPIINMKMSLATEDKSYPVEGIGTLRFRSKDSLTSRLVSKTSTETPSTSEKPDVSSDNHSLIPCTEVKWIRNIGRKVTGSNVYYSIEGEATRLKSFNEIERYYKRHNIKYDPSLFNFRKDNTESQGFSDLSEQQEALMVEVTIPNCYKQAIRSRDSSKWHDAMDKEINVMKERKVSDLVDHPDNIKILENRWVYTIKYDENNKIVRYKARLVAGGNTQLRSESFDEVFQEYKLELSKVKSLKLRCYSDSDFATNRDDRVSMGGFITFIDETPISSRTFKQKSVSLSTMEAEYVSLTEAAKEFIWLKNVIDNKSLNLELSENIMFCDNQAAISFSKSPVENYRTKHIDVFVIIF